MAVSGSRCFEYAVHFYIKETTSWVCDACKGRTTESPKCPDWMARLEGAGKRNPVCAKSQPSWEEAVDKKRQVFSKPRGAAKVHLCALIRLVHPNTIPYFDYTGSLRDDERVSFSSFGAKGRPCSAISVSGVHEPAPQSAPLNSVGMVSFRSRMFWRSTRRIMAGW